MTLVKTSLLVWLPALLSIAPGHASATIYKCAVEAAGVVYQDAPCLPGQERRDFDRDPGNVSVVPFANTPTAGSSASSRHPAAGKPPRPAGTKTATARTVARPRKSAAPGNASQRRFLRPGMSEGEVTARVGPPDLTTRRSAKGSRWTYMPATDDANTITTLVFENGKLADVERKVIR